MKTKISLKNLIEKGKFTWVSPRILEENFPIPDVISSDYKLIHPNKFTTSDEVIELAKKEGYRPANLYELLQWEDWNGTDWVIALGSVAGVGGDRGCPYLVTDNSGRSLRLIWLGGSWHAPCRFLLVRDLSSVTKTLENNPLDYKTFGHFAFCPYCNNKIELTKSND